MDGEKTELFETMTSFGTVERFDRKRPFSIEVKGERIKNIPLQNSSQGEHDSEIQV